MKGYLGIDFGTSGARGNVIAENDAIISEIYLNFPKNASQDWVNCWRKTLGQLLTKIPEQIRQNLVKIAINGTSSTVLLCDSQGNPLDNAILYNDQRATAIKAELSALVPPNHLVNSPSSSLAKLLWWSHQPEFSQSVYFLHQADWLGFLLHGHLGISDYHNALKLGYDVEALGYPQWLENAPFRPLLPQVFAPGTDIAPVTPEMAKRFSLSPHCRVCTGTTDSIAALIASGVTQPGEAVTSLGSTLVLKLLSEKRIENQAFGIYSHRWGKLWLAGGASNTGGAVLRHFFSDEALISLSQAINPTQESPLDYYPLLQPGDRFPINDPSLSPRLEPRPDDPVAFLHGLLESIARIEALGYGKLQELGANSLKCVYTSGGGAKNPTWQQIRQRQLHVRVHIAPHTQASYGTALLAKRGMKG